MGSTTGGVAPYTCSPLGSSVVFNFSESYNDMDQLCFTIAQESAHALSLDHEFDCNDPMTYLNGCGFKTFQDENILCGRNEVEACGCGRGSRQNSVTMLGNFLGLASDQANPTVSVSSPSNGGYAAVAQDVVASVNDDRAIERVEWWLDGTKKQEQRFGPYAWKLPATLDLGAHSLEVKVWDIAGKTATASVAFTLTVDGQAPECEGPEDCAEDEVCYQLQCWPDDIERLPLGEQCTGNGECLSGLCADDGTDKLCTQECTDSCPEGFACVPAGGTSVCWPGEAPGEDPGEDPGTESGGCASGPAGGGAGGALATLICLVGLALVRRRSRI